MQLRNGSTVQQKQIYARKENKSNTILTGTNTKQYIYWV